jgi:hypothetical protein
MMALVQHRPNRGVDLGLVRQVSRQRIGGPDRARLSIPPCWFVIVHLYAQCWNDGWMLPFFFRHYDRLVDRYFMFDDGSSDGTSSILSSHPKVESG